MPTARNTATAMVLIGLLVGALATGGCDVRPGTLKTADGKVLTELAINASDGDEVAAVGDLQAAATKYEQALKVLHTYYEKVGALDQQIWSDKELTNFRQAKTWRYVGVEPPAAPADQSVDNANEAGLIEQVLGARDAWTGGLKALADLYAAKGMTFKLTAIQNVQARFDPIRTYEYFLHAEIPPASLKPQTVSKPADDLFGRALKLHKRGKILPAVTNYNKQRQALGLFRQLVREHPTSDKIAKAAYYVGEIYKEYFDENVRAVHWYERAWQWDPDLLLPARFQAATVYDLRLAQYGTAVRLYQEVIKHERFNWTNVRFARRRIEELTGQ